MPTKVLNFRIKPEDEERVNKLCEDEYLTRGVYLRGCVLKDLAKRGY